MGETVSKDGKTTQEAAIEEIHQICIDFKLLVICVWSNLQKKSTVQHQRFEMGSLLWKVTEVQERWGQDLVLQVCSSTSSWQSLQWTAQHQWNLHSHLVVRLTRDVS